MHNFSVFNQNLDQISKYPNLDKSQFAKSRRDTSNLSDPQLKSLKKKHKDYLEIDLPELRKLSVFDQSSLIDQIDHKPSFHRIQKLREKIILSTSSNQSPIQIFNTKFSESTINNSSRLKSIRFFNNTNKKENMITDKGLSKIEDLINLSYQDDRNRLIECRRNIHSDYTYPLLINEKQYLVY